MPTKRAPNLFESKVFSVERIELDGWEPVLIDEQDGTRAKLKIHDHPVVGGYLILLKRPKS